MTTKNIPVEQTSIKDKLLAVQKRVSGKVAFDSVNPHFKNKYASLESVIDKLMPSLNDVGLVLTQKVALVDGFWVVRTVVMDGSALEELCCMPIINPKGDAQGFGSALSYAKRYSLMSAFAMVGGEEDDDGEGAQGRETRREPVKPKQDNGIYDGSPQAKDRLWQVMTRHNMSREQAKVIEPKLVGKTWIDCELQIDAFMTMEKGATK